MSLKKLTYHEHENEPRYWGLKPVEFGGVNLLVGRNSTGKSRVLNVILSFARLLSSNQVAAFSSGRFEAELEIGGKIFKYLIWFKDSKIEEEHLTVDGIVRLTRNSLGDGKIYFSAENKDILFQLPVDVVAFQAKNDQLQHPFIHELKTWADGVVHFEFGSDFGRSSLIAQVPEVFAPSSGQLQKYTSPNVIQSYIRAFERFGVAFDTAIIRDMKKLGYSLKDVGAEPLNAHIQQAVPSAVIGLVTVEEGLDIRNPQIFMSQGMFRALALIIHLNIATFSQEHKVLLIDDIGEGLDFERATQIIDLLIEAAQAHNIQIIMTSNDRFVMNKVSLDHWVVLERVGKVVTAYTPKNSPERFDEFKYVGLSNFDFFKDTRFQ